MIKLSQLTLSPFSSTAATLGIILPKIIEAIITACYKILTLSQISYLQRENKALGALIQEKEIIEFNLPQHLEN